MVGPVNVDACIATLQAGECVSERALKYLCQAVSELLMEESNVQPVLSPVTVVGDLHGQFFDLLHLLSPTIGGWPPQTSYVFLGDFVDRGHNSVETLSLLLALKLKYPGHVTLLRGNHEVRCMYCIICIVYMCCRGRREGGGSCFVLWNGHI
jgi:serine/threonine-protein phosphatase 6 catalytic subunit